MITVGCNKRSLLHRSLAPSAETHIAVDVKLADEAVAWAAKIPAAHGGGAVEVHPILSM